MAHSYYHVYWICVQSTMATINNTFVYGEVENHVIRMMKREEIHFTESRPKVETMLLDII